MNAFVARTTGVLDRARVPALVGPRLVTKLVTRRHHNVRALPCQRLAAPTLPYAAAIWSYGLHCDQHGRR